MQCLLPGGHSLPPSVDAPLRKNRFQKSHGTNAIHLPALGLISVGRGKAIVPRNVQILTRSINIDMQYLDPNSPGAGPAGGVRAWIQFGGPLVNGGFGSSLIWLHLFLILLAGQPLPAAGQQPSAFTPAPAEQLHLADFVTRVMQHNENLQLKLLDFEISQRRYRAERGIFEPELTGSFERAENLRENSSEQSSAQFGRPTFAETNNIYSGGIESLVPTGARIRLGYSLRDMRNTLQSGARATNGEYQSFLGVSVTQPLLKNFGPSANLAAIRVAALSSEIAFQDYRRQLMIIVSTAEASYWNLFMAQEQVASLSASVAVAETVLGDNQTRNQAGRGSDLEVLESQAALALRQAKLDEARQRLQEAVSQVVSLFQDSTVFYTGELVAVDQPETREITSSLLESWSAAREFNPDHLANLKRYGIEAVRLSYARNQRLPQLDLKGSYGLNGLGETPGSSWDDIHDQDYPSWSVGVELRLPLGTGVKSRNELAAARLSQEKARRSLRDTENQILNGIDIALKKAANRHSSIQNYQRIVEFNHNLLETQMARLQVGRVESRKVLEVEADLLEAKQGVTEAQVQYRRALLEKELVEGTVLFNRKLDVTRLQLQARTRHLGRWAKWSDTDYETRIRNLPVRYPVIPVINSPTSGPTGSATPPALNRLEPATADPSAISPK